MTHRSSVPFRRLRETSHSQRGRARNGGGELFAAGEHGHAAHLILRYFGRRWAILRKLRAVLVRPCRKCQAYRGNALAQLLRLHFSSIDVFRAAVLSIVFTLATGQNAVLLCRNWCDSVETTADGCQHQAQAVSRVIAGETDCQPISGAIALLRDDARRGASAPDAQLASLAEPGANLLPASPARSVYEPVGEALPGTTPLLLQLRI